MVNMTENLVNILNFQISRNCLELYFISRKLTEIEQNFPEFW